MTCAAVLHVVDDEAARDSLVFLLESEGFAVKAYMSAVAFRDEWPDLTSVASSPMSGCRKRTESRC